jgi:hypothetical protein
LFFKITKIFGGIGQIFLTFFFGPFEIAIFS